MIYEVCKMVLFRIWLGPVVRSLFDGVVEVLDGSLKYILTYRSKKIV